MKYVFLFLLIFSEIAFGCDFNTLVVNSEKNISAKVSLRDNDLLEVSVLEAGKQIYLENVDVSSEKKITSCLKITIVMVIQILVFGIWMRGWGFIKFIDYLYFHPLKKSSENLNLHAEMNLSI